MTHKLVVNVGKYGYISKVELDGQMLPNVERVELDLRVEEPTRIVLHLVAVEVEIDGEVMDVEEYIKVQRIKAMERHTHESNTAPVLTTPQSDSSDQGSRGGDSRSPGVEMHPPHQRSDWEETFDAHSGVHGSEDWDA